MKAMILAAGRGARVQPLTFYRPKPMLPLLGRPLIAHLIDHLKRQGVSELMINTSYHADAIEHYLGDGSHFGMNIGYSFEGYKQGNTIIDEPIGSAAGIAKIQRFSKFFDDTFIVVCGDALIDVDFEIALDFHRQKKALATVVMCEVDRSQVHRYGVIVTDNNGKISSFQEKPIANEALSTTINTGIYIFEPAIFDFIPHEGHFDIGSQLFPQLVAANAALYGVKLPFQWVDVGNLHDFWEANIQALQGKITGCSLPGKAIAPDVHVGLNVNIDLTQVTLQGPIYIGSNSHIEAGSTLIGPCYLGNHCHIKAHSHIESVLLGDYSRTAAHSHLMQIMYYDGHALDSKGIPIVAPQLSDSRCLD